MTSTVEPHVAEELKIITAATDGDSFVSTLSEPLFVTASLGDIGGNTASVSARISGQTITINTFGSTAGSGTAYVLVKGRV